MADEIRARLFELQDTEYRDFNAKIVNNIDKERMIGVRSPDLKKLAAAGLFIRLFHLPRG